jgi:hypothetical protein
MGAVLQECVGVDSAVREMAFQLQLPLLVVGRDKQERFLPADAGDDSFLVEVAVRLVDSWSVQSEH